MIFSNQIISSWLSSKEKALKKSSYLQYKQIAEVVTRETDEIIALNELDGQKLYERLSPKYSLKTIRSIFTVANQIVLFAYKNGYFEVAKAISFKSRNTRNNTVDVLSVKELTVFTNYLMQDMDSSKFGVLLCLYTGMRLGELCGLKWEDFNIKRKSIFIRRTIQRISEKGEKSYFSIDTPKTDNSVREIPFPPPLNSIIVSQYKQHKGGIYVSSRKREFVQPRTYQNRLKSYFRKCGLPGYHFHTLRHTFASRAVELGFDVKSLSEILGHSNIQTTLELYTHPSLECKAKEVRKFSKFIKNNTQKLTILRN